MILITVGVWGQAYVCRGKVGGRERGGVYMYMSGRAICFGRGLTCKDVHKYTIKHGTGWLYLSLPDSLSLSTYICFLTDSLQLKNLNRLLPGRCCASGVAAP